MALSTVKLIRTWRAFVQTACPAFSRSQTTFELHSNSDAAATSLRSRSAFQQCRSGFRFGGRLLEAAATASHACAKFFPLFRAHLSPAFADFVTAVHCWSEPAALPAE